MYLLPIDVFYYHVVIHVMQFFAFIDTIDIRPVLVNIRVKAVRAVIDAAIFKRTRM